MDGVDSGVKAEPTHLHRRGPRGPEAGAAAEEGAGERQHGVHGGGPHAPWRGGGMLLMGVAGLPAVRLAARASENEHARGVRNVS